MLAGEERSSLYGGNPWKGWIRDRHIGQNFIIKQQGKISLDAFTNSGFTEALGG